MASIKPNVAIWTAMIAAAATIIAALITVLISHDGGGGKASSTDPEIALSGNEFLRRSALVVARRPWSGRFPVIGSE
jgi:hypothetical protein